VACKPQAARVRNYSLCMGIWGQMSFLYVAYKFVRLKL